MQTIYDADRVRDYYDGEEGAREWSRLEDTLQGRIEYAIHRQTLLEHVDPGMKVLDVGCGPGRFAIDLIRAGATPTLADISQVQLDLARGKLAEAGLGCRAEGFHRADVLDLRLFPDNAFDAAVCFGGAVSYSCERYPDALSELARVVRPGGRVLVSVMSLYGILKLVFPLDLADFLDSIQRHLDWPGVLEGKQVVLTTEGSPEFHLPMALFTSSGMREALQTAGLGKRAMVTSNPLSQPFLKAPRLDAGDTASERLAELELALCVQPGLLDAGDHLIAVAEKLRDES